MNDHLIMEVDEDLRRERLQKFWQTFGKHIVTASLIIVIGVVSLVGWQNYQKSQRAKWTSEMLVAMEHIDNDRLDDAAKVLTDISKNADYNFKSISNIWLGQIAIRQADVSKAKEILTTIAEDENNAYATFAKILLINNGLSDDKGNDFAKNSDSLVLQEAAALSQLKNSSSDEKKLHEAIATLENIAQNVITPRGAKERLSLLLPELKKEYNYIEPKPATTDKTKEDNAPKTEESNNNSAE